MFRVRFNELVVNDGHQSITVESLIDRSKPVTTTNIVNNSVSTTIAREDYGGRVGNVTNPKLNTKCGTHSVPITLSRYRFTRSFEFVIRVLSLGSICGRHSLKKGPPPANRISSWVEQPGYSDESQLCRHILHNRSLTSQCRVTCLRTPSQLQESQIHLHEKFRARPWSLASLRGWSKWGNFAVFQSQ